MIYIQTNPHLHTDEPQTTFNFSQQLKGETAVLRKSLLVIYYYLKEKKLLPQSFTSKMSLEVKRIKENKERKSFKNDGERFFEKLPCLINRQITGFKPLRGEINPAEPYNLLIC